MRFKFDWNVKNKQYNWNIYVTVSVQQKRRRQSEVWLLQNKRRHILDRQISFECYIIVVYVYIISTLSQSQHAYVSNYWQCNERHPIPITCFAFAVLACYTIRFVNVLSNFYRYFTIDFEGTPCDKNIIMFFKTDEYIN